MFSSVYAAPEVLENLGYDYRCDLFSLGGVIFDLISKVKLTSPLSIIVLKNEQKFLEVKLKENISNEIKSIMFNLLQEDPKKRISIEKIVQLLNGNLNHSKVKIDENLFSPIISPSSSKNNFNGFESFEEESDDEIEDEITSTSKEEIETIVSLLKEKKSGNLLNDKESIIEALKYDVVDISSVSFSFLRDRDINLTIIKKGYPFEHIDETMQLDKEIIKEAIKLEGSKLKFVSKDLLMDKEFMKEIAEISPFSFQYSPLNNDKEFTLNLIENDEICFFYVSPELQNDFNFCLDCISRNFKSFQYFPSSFHSNKKFIKKSMIENLKSLQYISENLKNDENFALELVEIDGMSLEYLSSNLKNNKKIAKCAYENNPDSYVHISNEIKYSIKSTEYKTISKISEGGEGAIYKVEKKGILYAEKRIIIDDINHLNETIKSFSKLLLLKHENIFKIIDIIQDENDVLETMMIRIIMELYDGDLSNYINSFKPLKWVLNMKENEIIEIGIQISKGIQYLHQNSIIHADLKPENIFYKKLKNGKIEIKIGDFGLNDFKKFEFYGSLMYVAPEVVDLSSNHSFSSDAFGLGGILMRMMKFEDELIYLKCLKDEFDVKRLCYSDELKTIILNLLKKDPLVRSSIEETIENLLKLKNSKTDGQE